MATFNYTTQTRKILADLYTPVGVYMRLRDIYPQSALMESSDYHGTENSRSLHRCAPHSKHRRRTWSGDSHLSRRKSGGKRVARLR